MEKLKVFSASIFLCSFFVSFCRTIFLGKNVVLKKARKELNYLTGDAAVRRMAELREKWEMDEIAVKKYAERIGKNELKYNMWNITVKSICKELKTNLSL